MSKNKKETIEKVSTANNSTAIATVLSLSAAIVATSLSKNGSLSDIPPRIILDDPGGEDDIRFTRMQMRVHIY